MIRRSSITWPIVLGASLLTMLVVLLVFWIIGQVISQQWVLLTLGIVCFTLILIGVVLYLVLTIKEVRLNQRQANFIDAVTHELKSPIASIKLYLQTLDMREVSQEQQREFHRFMLEDVQRLDSLIDDLLEVARLDHRPSENVVDINLNSLLQQVVEVILRRYSLSESSIRIESQPAWITARTQDLELVLINLLDNAIKYGGEPKQVLIQVQPRGATKFVIRVSDNGPGVPFDQRRKIFQRFVRGGSELERSTHGTGLGLFLVRELVSRMRGRISVHSRGPLPGATFELELPGRGTPPEPLTASPSVA